MASAQIADFSVSASTSSISSGGTATVTIDSSQLGFDYYLRDNSNDTIIDGPKSGTGSSLTFNTGVITVSSSYNVFVKDQNSQLDIQSHNDYIDLTGDDRNIDKEVTVAAWIKTSLSSGIRNIVTDYGAGDAGYVLRIDVNGKAAIVGRDGTGNFKTSGISTTDVTDDVWHYVVGTIDLNPGGLWKIYVDGVMENSNNYGPGNSLVNVHNLFIGHIFSSSFAYNGKLRDVTIWNKALTDSAISANENHCFSGSEANIVGHFLLNENDTTTIDYSSTAINGTYQNGTPVFVTDSTSCNDSLQMSQIVNLFLVGVNELSTNDLSIYPNPVSSQLRINNANPSINYIEILDVTGKTVKTINSNYKTVNVSDLTKGIYFLQVYTEDGLINKKFIKE